MKRLFLYALLLCLPQMVCAQKKAINEASNYIKSAKNLDKAESLMTGLLKDSANLRNEKIWTTLIDAVKLQYVQGNEKLYLKQKYDTASLFTIAKKLFDICERFDSIDALPNKKGVVKIKYRTKNADYLNGLRPNLYNGGAFFLRKLDFQRSWDFYDAYLDCERQPLFSGHPYASTDSLRTAAAYWALYSGYRLKDADKVLKYQALAETDTAKLDNVLQYVAETHLLQADTMAYMETLRRGFANNPKHVFFFPRIVDYYNVRGMADSATVYIDGALASDSTNVLFLFAKSTALLNAGQYDRCIKLTERLLALNDSMPEAYCNMGLAYYNQALTLERTMTRNRKKRKAVNELYEKSRPFMERFRALAPDQKEKWVPALYTIYLNLNMGKEFDEIDKLREKITH